MNEAETRAEHIDPALKEAGWGVVDAMARIDPVDIRKKGRSRRTPDFVLSHYVSVGVEKLDQDKLTPLLRLEVTTRSPTPWPTRAGQMRGFQKSLYPHDAVA